MEKKSEAKDITGECIIDLYNYVEYYKPNKAAKWNSPDGKVEGIILSCVTLKGIQLWSCFYTHDRVNKQWKPSWGSKQWVKPITGADYDNLLKIYLSL